MARQTPGAKWTKLGGACCCHPVQAGLCKVRASSTVLLEPKRQTGVVLHMDDISGSGDAPSIRDFKGGDISENGKPYDHLKRLRTNFAFSIELNPKYLQSVLDALNLADAGDVPPPGLFALLGTTLELKPPEASLLRSCMGAFLVLHTRQR